MSTLSCGVLVTVGVTAAELCSDCSVNMVSLCDALVTVGVTAVELCSDCSVNVACDALVAVGVTAAELTEVQCSDCETCSSETLREGVCLNHEDRVLLEIDRDSFFFDIF